MLNDEAKYERRDIVRQGIRVILITLGPIVKSRGGVERVFVSMANELTERGYRVTALCCDPNEGTPVFKLDSRVDFVNVWRDYPWYYKSIFGKVLCWDLEKDKRKLKRELMLMRWKTRLLSSIRTDLNLKSDLFVAFQMQSAWAVRNAFGEKVKLITMFHSYPEIFTKSSMWRLYGSAVNSSNMLAVLMSSYISIARSYLPDVRIECMPNAVKKIEQRSSLERKVIICVARLSRGKCAELLVDAWSYLYKKYPDWCVQWWGELTESHSYTQEIIKRIDEKGVSGSFCLCGVTDVVHEKLLDASIFAFPSSYEGFPLALTEALSCGLPVVGRRDCPGVNELIKDGENGFLVSTDPQEWVQVLERLMCDYETRKRLGDGAIQSVQQYDPDCVWENWVKVIDDIVEQ